MLGVHPQVKVFDSATGKLLLNEPCVFNERIVGAGTPPKAITYNPAGK